MAPPKSWYGGYLQDAISRIWGWSPSRKQALKRARLPGPFKAGEELWKCERCDKEPLTRKERDVDHLVPRENVNGWDSWNEFIARALDVKADGLMVVCKPCHQQKSESENKKRPHRRRV